MAGKKVLTVASIGMMFLLLFLGSGFGLRQAFHCREPGIHSIGKGIHYDHE